FALDPVQGKPHRIVVDVYRDDGKRAPPPQPKPAVVEESTQSASAAVGDGNDAEAQPAESVAERPFVKKITRVVIDAGHGGEDPGAKGLYGLREKELTLDIARRLASKIDRHPEMEAVLTRDGDYFLSLGNRSSLARKERGDVFISIHANAARSRSASGFELFFLSLRGSSDKMARELADKENAADLIGGIEPTEDEVLSIVFDYLQEEGMQKSAVLAESIYKRFQRDGSIRLRNVRQAGFAVLKTVEVPSVLVELGFISNQAEAKRLKSDEYRDKLARLLMESIEQYCQRVGGNGTRYHVVKDGETPWSIAERYSRTVKDLLLANNLAPDAVLRVGQKLRVP
ncbi:MAG: LysM peptidoglycan-binding domain-containing protein, partial [Gemmatimonadetes bacterium]|nr:LysM peptidoglycan-binding domain-containing protein [Gemmatimonadota bacterium]